MGSNGYIAFTQTTNPNYAIDSGVNYNGSTVQQYLNGHGINTFAKEYGISKSSLYANISAVNLAGEPYFDERDRTTDTTQDTDNQKLWLLSYDEFNKYFGEDDSSAIGYFNGSADYWWLRSPNGVYSDEADMSFIHGDDASVSSDAVCSDCGVRAAFQITIA